MGQNNEYYCIEVPVRRIRTHGSGSYVGLASDWLRWAWFLIERFKTVAKRCLYWPARI